MDTPPLYFYFPYELRRDLVGIERMSEQELWKLLAQHRIGRMGVAHWVVQTYYFLVKNGTPCSLIDTPVDRGIIFTHRDCLPLPIEDLRLMAGRRRTVCCMQVDRKHRYSLSDFTIVHNPLDERLDQQEVYVPPWPQIALKPRSEERGNTVRTVGYIGNPEQLDPYFTSASWRKFLDRHGLRFVVKRGEEWNDFTDLDVLIGVRSFDTPSSLIPKPALKLFNAWSAGVPILLTQEPSYTHYQTDEYDYVEVSTIDTLEVALSRLVSQPEVYQTYRLRCKERAATMSHATVLNWWKRALNDIIIPHHQRKSYLFVGRKRMDYYYKTGRRYFVHRTALGSLLARVKKRVLGQV